MEEVVTKMMFQPPLDARDYGQARILPSEHIWLPQEDSKPLPEKDDTHSTHLKERDLNEIIISYFNRWSKFPLHDDNDGDIMNNGQDWYPLEQCLVVSNSDLRRAIRNGFYSMSGGGNEGEMKKFKKSAIMERQRFAIDCVSILEEQKKVWNENTSVSVDWDRGIRIVATSR
jgi:hypothetical protein